MGRGRKEEDRRPYRVYVRQTETDLLVCDGLIYRGKHCAEREVRKIRRVLGREAQARPATG
jgi:hypothetical protein